jgi:ABC-type glycerol-3-phosphate transport system substrate-binding protein
MPHPIHENSLKWMKQWAAQHNVTLTLVPVSYEVYVEKMTANLTSRGGQYDIIWHNDDWGQLWGRYLEPVDDVAAIKKMSRFILEPPFIWEGKDTGVPFVETVGTRPFFRCQGKILPATLRRRAFVSVPAPPGCLSPGGCLLAPS